MKDAFDFRCSFVDGRCSLKNGCIVHFFSVPIIVLSTSANAARSLEANASNQWEPAQSTIKVLSI
jgi:hypothetical protein